MLEPRIDERLCLNCDADLDAFTGVQCMSCETEGCSECFVRFPDGFKCPGCDELDAWDWEHPDD